uniref:Protein kinase domain-containing protein n=1 Tax=Zea mays TaxID=4577 RepID=A0A804PIE1_MAIZE
MWLPDPLRPGYSSPCLPCLPPLAIVCSAVRAVDAGGQGDPEECGVKAYELVCSNDKATIRINTGTYFVTSIDYINRSFWVVDANLDMHNSCPLPRWDPLLAICMLDTAPYTRAYYSQQAICMLPSRCWATPTAMGASSFSTIGRIHHINVVRLVGFCAEEMRRALAWESTTYLHLGCDMQILHFDIKPHNILLDNNFVPKVSDFGLAKLYPRDKSFVPASAMRGTIGYIAPEMISRSFGAISSKSDVYSFAEQEAGEISVAADMHELERKLCIVGLRCIQMKPQDRPTMGEIIEMLECGTHGLGLQMPSRPFFCDDDDPNMPAADSYHFSSELTAISEEDG